MQDSTRKILLKFSQLLMIPVTLVMIVAMLVPAHLNPIITYIPWFTTACSSLGLARFKWCYPQFVLLMSTALFFLVQCLVTGLYIMSPEERAEANRNL